MRGGKQIKFAKVGEIHRRLDSHRFWLSTVRVRSRRKSCYPHHFNYMIHSMGGGVIREYDKLIYVFVLIEDGLYKGEKHWYISPFNKIKVGDRVEVPAGSRLSSGSVLRVENVTAQTAPFPVNRTREVERIL